MNLQLILDIVKVILLFSITIFVHELGHFLTARWFGLTIEVFSIGIGPAIWKRKYKGVIYKIGWIPFGGYVALPQMDPTLAGRKDKPSPSPAEPGPSPAEPGPNDAEPVASAAAPIAPMPPLVKIIVALSGALGNIVLALLLAWIIYVVGKPSTPAERSAVIGFVETNSAAYAAGLRAGDEILAINNRLVSDWTAVLQENARHAQVTLSMRTPQGLRTLDLATEKSLLGFNMLVGVHASSLCRVMAVEADSSAARAGVRANDLIKTFAGTPVLSIEHLIALVADHAEQTVELTVERAGRALALQVTPQLDPALARARIGIRFDPMAVDADKVLHIPPSVQLKSHATAIFRVLASLMTPREARATSQGLGGPFMIIFMLFDMVRRGLVIALWFTCFLNVNLAILNLLPIPILDGGHILFALFEALFRKPLNPKFINVISQLFAILIIIAFLLLSGRDVLRINQIRQLSKNLNELEAPINNGSAPSESQTN